MADRKKNSHRSQATALKTPTSRKQAQMERSVKAPAPEDQERKEFVPAKSVKALALEEPRESVPTKETKVLAREGRRQSGQATKAPRRESKSAPRWRNNPIGRFIYDAYYELRYKVTWPTLKEAKNMTMVVLALSAVIGGIIALADYGLHELFIFIVTKSWPQ
jgi:preprotein translocase SecE subunit